MKVSQFFIFGLSPIDYSKDFTKAFFLGLSNPQNSFVFCFKVDLDLAESKRLRVYTIAVFSFVRIFAP